MSRAVVQTPPEKYATELKRISFTEGPTLNPLQPVQSKHSLPFPGLAAMRIQISLQCVYQNHGESIRTSKQKQQKKTEATETFECYKVSRDGKTRAKWAPILWGAWLPSRTFG